MGRCRRQSLGPGLDSEPTELTASRECLSVFFTALHNPVVQNVKLPRQQSRDELKHMVFRGVLTKSPAAFSGEKGLVWGNRSPEVAHTQDREARANVRLAPSKQRGGS